ncbi:MAG: hypothetical protein KKC30_01935 [Proteobacteria bacterium]|nr:hypothetical protein [Pseudomonadota bacterium]MBU4382756.1 hypothetical protein [Pseudomonadota bacterium]MBU4605274.1 hypothetical protein [Pseudomonadota bacterium]MCG2765271.1 hypothetical protein [Desulfarculaceae bacterium]
MSALSRQGKFILLTLLVLLCLPLPAAGEGGGRALFIDNPQTGLMARLPAQDVDYVTIRFFHSYDCQWVEESFKLVGGKFYPYEVSYGADTYDYRDQRYQSRARVGAHQVHLTDIKPRPSDILAQIATRVAFTKPQQLILHTTKGNRVYLFTEWGRPGQPLVFSIK